MDLDSFQSYDSISHYGGGHSVTDDTASVISGYTTTNQRRLTDELEALGLNDDAASHVGHQSRAQRARAEDEFESVLDDLKADSMVDLPPHACR